MDCRALTKIQSAGLIAIIVVAAVSGVAGYVLWRASLPPPENIVIGVVTDLGTGMGEAVLQGVILAAEQLNAQGGILGRNVTIISEDDDCNSPPYDVSVAVNALTRLITVDKADYVIWSGGLISVQMTYQDICFEHKKIIISVNTQADNVTQRVLDDYDRYKYFFKVYPANSTINTNGALGNIMTVGRYTGFTKIALLFGDVGAPSQAMMAGLKVSLPQNGYEVVYANFYAQGTTDFSSYFAAIEKSGAEILYPQIANTQLSIAFIKEWYTRMSPVVVWGYLPGAINQDLWKLTEGGCDTVSYSATPIISGYPLTNKTLPTREAYLLRWGVTTISGFEASAYDALRFILPDAIKRAATFETEAVIKALEKTDIETSMARHFMFTSSHDVMVGGTVFEPSSDSLTMFIFQWQNGTQVPVMPEAIMKEAGVTYKYPPWPGPWSK